MLGVNVTYMMKPGKREEFLSEVVSCGALDAIRKEDGCLQYDYHLSCEEKDTVVLIECWRDAAALAAHAAAPHMARVAAMKEGRVKETNLKRYE